MPPPLPNDGVRAGTIPISLSPPLPPALLRVGGAGVIPTVRSGDSTRERPGAAGPHYGRTRSIALLIGSEGPGSAQSVLLHLAEGLRTRGFRVVPILPVGRGGWLSDHFRRKGFRTTRFPVPSSFAPRSVHRLAGLLQRERVNVAHAHEFACAVHGAGASAAAKIPCVITMHGEDYREERLFRRVALRWAAGRSRALVAVSRATARDLARSLFVGPGRIEVVLNGIAASDDGDGGAVRRELGVEPREPFFLSVGSLRMVKGHRVLVRALDALRLRRPELPWKAAIAGRGRERPWLERYVTEHGLGDRVRLLGHRDDLSSLLRAADVFVLPSISDGLPVALLEAMFAAKPTVASSVGGVPEVVRHEETGLLVPPSQPDELSTALARLCSNPALQMRLGTTARREVSARFTVDAMVDAYVRLYGFSGGGGRPPYDEAPATDDDDHDHGGG